MAADYLWVYRVFGEMYQTKQHAQDVCDVANMHMWRHPSSADYNWVERVKVLKGYPHPIDFDDVQRARERREQLESDARTK